MGRIYSNVIKHLVYLIVYNRHYRIPKCAKKLFRTAVLLYTFSLFLKTNCDWLNDTYVHTKKYPVQLPLTIHTRNELPWEITGDVLWRHLWLLLDYLRTIKLEPMSKKI